MTDRQDVSDRSLGAGREADVMTTSQHESTPTGARGPLRLRLAEHPGQDRLDGGWWPRSRDLAVELADLVDHFPAERGRIMRAVVSPPDWEPAPRRIPVRRGYVKVGSFPRDDTHVVDLSMQDHSVLRLLVVPAAMTPDQGGEALLAAATPRSDHSAAAILETVSEHPDVNPERRWTDDGETWWAPHEVAPSFREAEKA
jgi:hypothetical protein